MSLQRLVRRRASSDSSSSSNSNSNSKDKVIEESESTATAAAAAAAVRTSRHDNLGVVTLHNPSRFHALNASMIASLQNALTVLDRDPSLHAWLLHSSSCGSSSSTTTTKSSSGSRRHDERRSSPPTKKPQRKSFCAGGDVKQLYQSGIEKDAYASDFFRHEYTLNYNLALLSPLPKKLAVVQEEENMDQNDQKEVSPAKRRGPLTQISVWDGMVMGGGVGISIFSPFRIATEHTTWSMPETAIGLFPDVGSTYWMPKWLKPSTAVYLALTGQSLQASDLLYAGIATHYIPSDTLPDLVAALAAATTVSTTTTTTPLHLHHHHEEEANTATSTVNDKIESVLERFRESPTPDPLTSPLAQDQPIIDQVFGAIPGWGGGTVDDDEMEPANRVVEKIMTALQKQQQTTSFAQATLQRLESMSPTSLSITLESLRRGSRPGFTLEDAFRMEYRMSQACLLRTTTNKNLSKDFFTGVKAKLIDKSTCTPPWQPSTLADVTPDLLQSYFAPVEHEWKPVRINSTK